MLSFTGNIRAEVPSKSEKVFLVLQNNIKNETTSRAETLYIDFVFVFNC